MCGILYEAPGCGSEQNFVLQFVDSGFISQSVQNLANEGILFIGPHQPPNRVHYKIWLFLTREFSKMASCPYSI